MLDTIADLFRLAQQLKGDYENRVIAELNDHVIRLSRMTRRYFWHKHPNSDEAFLGIEGVLVLEMEDRTLELHPGQFWIVPKEVWHCTLPQGEHSVNLTIERRDMETVRPD